MAAVSKSIALEPAGTPVQSFADVPQVPPLVDVEIQQELEQFLYLEAELLDGRKYREWYALLADDLSYFMPTRANRTSRELGRENSARGYLANFDDDKRTMDWRIKQIETGMHWAEDPPSRTRHLVSNVRVDKTDVTDEFQVKSNFICYRNRLEREVDLWAGERDDVVRAVGPRRWQLVSRYILLDENVLLAKNLSVFF